jgi:molecular chaperone DnaJ
LKGKGVPSAKGAGDLIVSFDVAVPQKLSSAQRKAIESLANASKESPRQHLSEV